MRFYRYGYGESHKLFQIGYFIGFLSVQAPYICLQQSMADMFLFVSAVNSI